MDLATFDSFQSLYDCVRYDLMLLRNHVSLAVDHVDPSQRCFGAAWALVEIQRVGK